MKTLIPAAIRCSLMFIGVAALSIVYLASVQAVPTTYQYTGNPFTVATGPYTTSDFVTAMVTLAGPTRSEHAAHPGHSYRFYIVRWGANNNQQRTRRRFFRGIPIRYGRIRGDQYVEGCGGDDIQ